MTGATRTDQDSIDLRAALHALRARWRLVLICTVVGALLLYGGSHLLAPTYEATALLVYEPSRVSIGAASGLLPRTEYRNIQSDAQAIRTRTVSERVRTRLNEGASAGDLMQMISVDALPELSLLRITASSDSGPRAAAVANGFAAEYVLIRQERAQEVIAGAQQAVAERLDRLTRYEAQSEYGQQLKRYHDDLGVQLDTQPSDFSIVDPAVAPSRPSSPQPMLAAQVGGLLGLLLGLGLVLLFGLLDNRIKDEDGLETEMGYPVLATIPLVAGGWGKGSVDGSSSVGFGRGKEELLESARLLRSSLKLLGFGTTSKTLLITSAGPDEGKTSTAANLALVMALSGERVILIDADVRMPRLHSYLGLANDKGLMDVLIDRAPWAEVAQPVDMRRFAAAGAAAAALRQGVPGGHHLHCITSGSRRSMAAEVLDSPAVQQLLQELSRISDYVIVDGPPLLVVSEALDLAQRTDAVLVASRLNKTTPRDAGEVRKLLDRAGANVLGTVVTGGRPRSSRSYYSRYYEPHPESLVPVRSNPAQITRQRPQPVSKARNGGGSAGAAGAGGNKASTGKVRAGGRAPATSKGAGGADEDGDDGEASSLAFVSDIHGNAPALQAVLADLQQRGIREVFCLGDLVGLGPFPAEVVQTVRELALPATRGDFDDCVAFPHRVRQRALGAREPSGLIRVSMEHTESALSDEDKEWLRVLPDERQLRVNEYVLRLIHGSPHRVEECLWPGSGVSPLAQVARAGHADVLLFGHTHRSWQSRVENVFMLNVGSIGLPLDGDPRAAYTIVHFVPGRPPSFETVRVAYPVEQTVQKLIDIGLPRGLADGFTRAI
jgi:polysaccharide biosynthesis transport protein